MQGFKVKQYEQKMVDVGIKSAAKSSIIMT